MLLFNCVAALTGVCTICIDPEGSKRYASVLEPMTALGPERGDLHARVLPEPRRHGGGPARGGAGALAAHIERLDRPDAVRDLPRHVHGLYLGGALYAGGVSECWRDDSRAIDYAERLEGLKLKLYEMSADQVRMVYYGNRGNLELFERYRARVEVHAIQRGTAWQVETWTHSGLITVYVRTQDAAGLKDCLERLKRLSAEVPSLRFAYKRALGACWCWRKRPRPERARSGAKSGLGLVGLRGRAKASARGRTMRSTDHARARETCVRALGYLTPENLKFCALNLDLQIQLARAEAGLGNIALGEEQLRGLLAAHEGAGNPLTVGALHEALADLAAMRGDRDAFANHLVAVDRWYRQTRNPALVARYEQLAREAVRSSSRPDGGSATDRAGEPSQRIFTFVHRLRHGGGRTLAGSAEWAVQQLSDFTDAREAYLFVIDGDDVTCAARIGGDEHLALIVPWVDERLRVAQDDPDGVATCTVDGSQDPNRFEVGTAVFRLTPLVAPALAPGGPGDEIVGAVVLLGDKALPFPVLQTLAVRLRATSSSSTERA